MYPLLDVADDPVLARARLLERSTRRPGCPNGVLGSIGLNLLEYFISLKAMTGSLSVPTISVISDDIARSRSAIVSGLAALEEHGFIRRNDQSYKPRYYLVYGDAEQV